MEIAADPAQCAATHKHAHTHSWQNHSSQSQDLIANVHFHSIWALEMDILPWGSKCKHAVAERIQSAPKTYLCFGKSHTFSK